MKKLLLLGLSLCTSMCMLAENIVNVVPRNITDADLVEDEGLHFFTLDVEVTNSTATIGAFGFKLYLPEGMEVAYFEREDNARTSWKKGLKNYKAFTAGDVSENMETDSYGSFKKVSAYGADLNPAMTEGVIGTIVVAVDKSVLVPNKVYPVYLRGLVLSNSLGDEVIYNEDADATSYITYGNVANVEEEIKAVGIIPSSVSESLSNESAKISLNMADVTGGVLTLSDSYGISEIPASATFETVSYTRSTLAAKYGTICVPFDLASDANVQYYTISEAAAGQITISKVASVPAGTPAIYENCGASEISFSGNDVTLAAAGTDGAGAELVGTYVKTKVTDANTYYLKDGKFNRINGSFNSGAFKAYAKSGSALAKALEIFVDDADPTAINGASTSASIEGIYNAAGAQNKKLEKGVNILKMSDGSVKKVLVK